MKLDIYEAPTDKAEAEYVVHQIESMMGGVSYFSLDSGRVEDETREAGLSFGDFAVLYRLNAQSRALEEAFHRLGIPYQTVGQTPFVARPTVRALLAALHLVLNPSSQLHRQQLKQVPLAVEALHAQVGDLPVVEIIDQLAQVLPIESEDDLRKLRDLARPFDADLRGFLTRMALQSETDIYDPRADRVALMTLHAAKGLEFPVVFIVGCEEGLLPWYAQGRETDIEEERRLFYVGMTRAKRKLILTHARKRFLFGKEMHNDRSHFVDDIETALLEARKMQGPKKKRKKKDDFEQLSLF